MFKNYIKIAFRNITRHKSFSFINISGLAIGMCCCLLIILFVKKELSYDKYHPNANRIFRMYAEKISPGNKDTAASIGAAVSDILKNNVPEILERVRFFAGRRSLVSYENQAYYEDRFFYADPEVFDVFSFPLIKGDPETALTETFSIVITESAALKYFGTDDPIGKSIILDKNFPFRITGVLQDVPDNSHFTFDFLASLETLGDIYGKRLLSHPGNMMFYSYVLLQAGADPSVLEENFLTVITNLYGERTAAMRSYCLQPLTSIHLHSQLGYEIEANGSVTYVYIYSIIAFFVLLIASFNFMNLSTARSSGRAREVGIRKVLGAFRTQLIKQHLGEAIFLSLIALFIAILMSVLLLPYFNALTGKEIVFHSLFDMKMLPIFLGFSILIGTFAGIYPALFLSSFLPILTLKGKLGTQGRSRSFRRLLVLAQFTISIILLTGTLVIQNQLNYVRNRNLGFNQEQTILIPINDEEIRKSYTALKTELQRNPSVNSVTACSSVPGKPVTTITYRIQGFADDDPQKMDTFFIDENFFDTLEIELTAGRNFSEEFVSDEQSAFIINETAANRFGWKEPLNKNIVWPSDLRKLDAIVKKGRVIGVVKDFNIKSLHESIGPVIFQIRHSNFRYLAVRIIQEDIRKTISFLRNTWNRFSPGIPFEYSFLDDDFGKLYRADEKVGKLMSIFSTLAILVACMGLLGLVSFAAEQRTKEIGIRKVLGARISGIMLLLSQEFLKWILIANLIAWPVAYLIMDKWLQGFAYRTTFNILTFILAGLSALIIAMATIGYQVIKVSLTNPADVLKYE